jgi:hypothetical protein
MIGRNTTGPASKKIRKPKTSAATPSGEGGSSFTETGHQRVGEHPEPHRSPRADGRASRRTRPRVLLTRASSRSPTAGPRVRRPAGRQQRRR